MPSSFTPRLRLELQAAGENLNTWGAPKLNNVISRLDFSVAGWTTIALTGNYALSASNGDDEARSAMLKFTGAGAYAVTIPSVSKRYDVWNALSGALTVTTGAGASVTLQPSEKCPVICDAANVYRLQGTEFGGARLTGVADPTGAQDAATKQYVDAAGFSLAGGVLPGQSGNAGKVLKTDGSVAGWGTLAVADIAGAAPTISPSFTGGMTLAGGVTFSGSTKANVQAVAAANFDLTVADYFTKSISSDTTFTFSGATAAKGQAFAVELTIASAAAPTWPANVRWAGGVAPSLANGRHILGFVTFDGGTAWTGIKSVIAAS